MSSILSGTPLSPRPHMAAYPRAAPLAGGFEACVMSGARRAGLRHDRATATDTEIRF